MKQAIAIAIGLSLALGCGAEYSDEPDQGEFGKLEQAYTAECDWFGVSLSGAIPNVCFASGSGDVTGNCHYPPAPAGINYAQPLLMGSGWTTNDRTFGETVGDAVAAEFNTRFGNSWDITQCPGCMWRFYKSTSDTSFGIAYGGSFMTVNKGTVGGGSISGTSAPWERIVSAVCTNSTGMSRATRVCNHWEVTMDTTKMSTQMCGGSCTTMFKNVYRHLYLLTMGQGLRSGYPSLMNATVVQKSTSQTQLFPEDEGALNSLPQNQENDPANFHCY
jgi:hypothetical protein